MSSLPPLVCPVCGSSLEPDDLFRTLSCPDGHRYDAAKQGYFNLLTGGGTKFQADTAAMVQARADFLAAGHYLPMAAELGRMVSDAAPEAGVVLDAGAGTGYYLGEVLRTLPEASAVALDISKYALRRAARALPRSYALVWDVWRRLPLPDASVDVILNVFAPRNPAEFRRVLVPGGLLAVVTPQPGHLQEIRGKAAMLGIPAEKEERVTASLGAGFTPLHTSHCTYTMQLARTDVRNAVLMGPSARHLAPAALEETISTLPDPQAVTASFSLQTFRAG
ncbi:MULTISPECIES: methyltransferase domain-containing protein [unclassified Arthrobacter]|uniref:methyltransferase domain-containing protein n=1 Tax=unclassified Arthrobacter TaxID=235627 RepID=UPI001E4904BA|nr:MULTISPECIES: methyltransferase domain-containing protein [unclassified Arthrobacter]MCC9145447.1 methyltransferase domain-containing protein [Arthrobacter sp. zg-Y919]MDK1276675.1 methyltransferase domain-containing protein [Arthrobacter sp. zg.Y919]WIB04378.1 methyltransferase domain-containing protein [Arthrobacter sp. zg-Y919]